MADLEIIGLAESNFVWATRIAAGEKGVPHVNRPEPPHGETVSAIHPFGKVPVMRHGTVRLCESRAIVAYVDRAFDGPPIVPPDPAAAGLAEQWASLIVTTIEPVLVRRYLFAYLSPGTPDGSPNLEAVAATLPDLARHLDAIDRGVAAGAIGGEAFALADAWLYPILFYLKGLPESGAALAARPRIADALERGLARPSVRATMPVPTA